MATTDPLKGRTREVLRADAAMAAAILLLGCFLAVTGNTLVQRWRSSSGRQQSVSFEDQLGITANLAGLLVIACWAVSFMAAVAAALLERAGRPRAAAAAARFSPGFMRRLALAGVGLQLMAAPLAAAAPAAALPGTGQAPTTAFSAAWVPVPEASFAADRHPAGIRPVSLLPTPPVEGTPAEDTPPPAEATPPPAPQWPPPQWTPLQWTPLQWTPLRPVVEPGPLASGQLRPPEPAAAPREVAVRAGDSLWSIAAARLGPLASDVEIATAWPRLYQANRDVIGHDPDALFPGQVLRLPPGM